jgi:hypothetical protein
MGGLFSKPPKPPKPVEMPVPDDAAAEEARRLAMQRKKDLVGRTDTILSGYSRENLGVK